MFSPFNKSFANLTEEDLQILHTVSEGWYIEYKGATPDSKKIAKSIASFSNSYGGLYILGVEADRNANRALNFPGVDIKLDSIHDAVKGNLNPFPYFESYIIPLQNGKNVIIVAVEEGVEPPYIHNDGRIYRRQESSSDPIHEINRYSIDQLYAKTGKYKEKVENFRTIDYGFCKGESDQPYLIGYVNPIRIEEVLINDFGNPEFQQKILDIFNKEVDINEPNIGWINGKWPFNNVTLLPESIILSNLSNVNIAHNTLTVELFKNGGMKFMMPITLKNLGNYSIMRMKDCCSRNTIDPHNIIKWAPIYDFMMPVIGLFINYFRFLHHYNYKDVLEVVFEGRNIWRVCLFSEDDSYFDYIQKFSLPIIIKENIKYPEKPCKIHIASHGDIEHISIMLICAILELASRGFGMPYSEIFTIFTAEAKKKALL